MSVLFRCGENRNMGMPRCLLIVVLSIIKSYVYTLFNSRYNKINYGYSYIQDNTFSICLTIDSELTQH